MLTFKVKVDSEFIFGAFASRILNKNIFMLTADFVCPQDSMEINIVNMTLQRCAVFSNRKERVKFPFMSNRE